MIQHIRALQKSSTPRSVKCGTDPGITSTYAKRQDCSTLSIPALFADLVLVFGVIIPEVGFYTMSTFAYNFGTFV